MRISVKKSKNYESVYIQKDLYLRDVRGKKSASNPAGKDRTTVTVERLGRMDQLMESMGMTREQVLEWARARAQELTEQEKAAQEKISIDLYPNVLIEKNAERLFACGYLFLQKLCTDLRMDNICRNIGNRHQYQYDLEAILRDLVYARILEPCSKQASYEFCQSLLEPPRYEKHDVYRALSVLSEESNYIQAEVFRNSRLILKRSSRVLYYDCTNFYFEIEQSDDFRKYGKSKEHRPNPIVQLGLFLDGDGLPIAFDTFPGNENEQPSMKPLEEKVIQDFDFEKFILCTDGGLGSEANRHFNHIGNRAFIMTQSIKKLSRENQAFVFQATGWKRLSNDEKVDIEEIWGDPDSKLEDVFYKDLPYDGSKVSDQRMLVTYSPKYRQYQKKIRDGQVERAKEMVNQGKKKKERGNPNDPARFVKKIPVTKEGEVVEKALYSLDQEAIDAEAKYDGFYAVCTDLLDDPAKEILKVSEGRWEIEECFRIMKTDFKARPVYLGRDDRIKAHFLICFLALLVYRLLEKKLDCKYTVTQIISTLRKMQLLAAEGVGYQPAYKRTDITDALHDRFGFRTDYQILKKSSVRSIIKKTKEITRPVKSTEK